jgi:hypothetical protein
MAADLGHGRRHQHRHRLEHHHPADVHVSALVGFLELEERRVERSKAIRGGHCHQR